MMWPLLVGPQLGQLTVTFSVSCEVAESILFVHSPKLLCFGPGSGTETCGPKAIEGEI